MHLATEQPLSSISDLGSHTTTGEKTTYSSPDPVPGFEDRHPGPILDENVSTAQPREAGADNADMRAGRHAAMRAGRSEEIPDIFEV